MDLIADESRLTGAAGESPGRTGNDAMYRRWRSRNFGELIGQGHITRSLRNAVRLDRLAHAYLFCGPRGIGKTSTARILAKAVNCLEPQVGEPCDRCEMCIEIRTGRSIDVIEIDAASNRGIEDIRELRERVAFAPAHAKRKVYILDEAHQITAPAFNALLKTIEEPPPNTIFVMVTTHPSAMPETILSRCQRFDFRPVSSTNMLEQLRLICTTEGISIDDASLAAIVRSAGGSLRDAESLLDQLTSATEGKITADVTLALAGSANPESLLGVIEAVFAGDLRASAARTSHLIEEGLDPINLQRELVVYLRAIHALQIDPELTNVLDVLPEEAELVRRLTGQVTSGKLLRIIRLLASRQQFSPGLRPSLGIELSIAEASDIVRTSLDGGKEETSGPPAEVIAGSTRSKQAVVRPPTRDPSDRRQPSKQRDRPPGPITDQEPAPAVGDRQESEPDPAAAAAGLSEEQWTQVINTFNSPNNRSIKALLRDASPQGFDGDRMSLGFKYDFHRNKIDEQKNRRAVEEAISNIIGRRITIQCVQIDGSERRRANNPHDQLMADPLVKAAIESGARVTRAGEDD